MAEDNLNSSDPKFAPQQPVVHNEPGPKIEDITDDGSKDEKLELEPKVTKANGESSNAERTKRLSDALEKLQKNQATHALYCPNCSLDITDDFKLFKKEKAPSPYDQKTYVLWLPFVFPFSSLWQWLARILERRRLKTLSNKETPKPVNHTISTGDTPNPPEVEGDSLPPSDGNTREPGWIYSLLLKINLLYLLVVVVVLVLPLLLVIVFWALPSSKGGGHKKPVLPSLPSLPLPMHFPIIKYLPVILLFLLAVLILAWRYKKGSMPSPTVLTDVLRDFIVAPFQLSSVKIDILKSIVYGGLIESITSLGVVSSAAGAGASTLNILALGVANLFSGLFLISHNLYVLLCRPHYEGENHDHMPNLGPKYNQYEILLGKKKWAWLHGFVVFVSLVIFAVIPPLLYGFSYIIIEGEHSKATVVFFVSLLCVICLSFAKAYAFSMDNKLIIVAEYTGIAIVASVVSFLAGHYFMDAFGKFDLH